MLRGPACIPLRYPAPTNRSYPQTGDLLGFVGWVFRRKVKALGITELISAGRSPWQNVYVERLIGSIRRECTDHIFPLSEKHLLRALREYQAFYNKSRTHSALGGNSPTPRAVNGSGEITSTPVLGGLHHRYARSA